MTYPGDPSLTAEIQGRVLSTFDQTATLAGEGRRQEALLGCDFMLRLDPLFEPARRLKERLEANDGPVEAADLLRPAAGAEPEAEVLKTVRLSAEELQRLMMESSVPDPADNASGGANDALGDADAPIELVPVAPADDEIQLVGPEEPEPADAGSFIVGARRALDSGQIEAARRLIDMAASLDPHNPELVLLRADLDQVTAGAVDLSPSSGTDRVQQLLDEGQRAFDEERYQEAIDCWSRIFLIEIDHEEASRRIQLARDLKEEQDRQVEETFQEGLAALDRGHRDRATAAFHRVLEMRPGHLAAREQLDHLVAAATPDEETAQADGGAAAPVAPAAPGALPADLQMPPETPQRAADPTYRRAARAKRQPVNPLVLVGAGVLVLVLAGAWFLAANWSRFFPNATEEPAPEPQQPIAEITAMHDRGEVEAAIAAAEQIGAESPDYLQARRLIARWREELASRAAATQPLSGGEVEQQVELIAQARGAYEQAQYLEAARFFTRASAIAPLAAPEAALYDDAKRQLEPIAQQIDLYAQRQWELVLPALWRRLEQQPDDRDVQQLLVNSYYNLTVRELRRADLANATTFVTEAVRLAPGDDGVVRLASFVDTYSQMPRDLLFEIYVQHLDFRR